MRSFLQSCLIKHKMRIACKDAAIAGGYVEIYSYMISEYCVLAANMSISFKMFDLNRHYIDSNVFDYWLTMIPLISDRTHTYYNNMF